MLLSFMTATSDHFHSAAGKFPMALDSSEDDLEGVDFHALETIG